MLSVNSTDLESHIVNEEGGGGGTSTNLIKSNQNVVNAIPSEDMSVCLGNKSRYKYIFL